MIPYPAYKTTDLAWLPRIPEHWGIMRAKNLFTRMNRPVSVDDEVITCFRDGEVTLRKKRRLEGFTESLKEIGYQGIRPGDLVIHQMDAFAGAIGVSDSKGKGTPVYICLQPKGSISNWYYAYLLRYMAKSGYIKALYRGIRERSSDFRWETMCKLDFPMPVIAEQEQIVRYLDSMTAKINKLIRAKKKQIALLQEQRQAIINQTVTKGLDPNVEMKDSGIRWGKTIPKHWQVMKAKYCVTINHGCDPITEGNIPVYGSGAESFKTCGEFKEGPAVLVGRKGATLHIPHFVSGKYWNVDTAFDVKNRNGFSLRFYFYLAKCFDYEYYISQTTLPGMTQTSYLNMKLPVPSFSEQNEIVGYLDDICRKYEFVIDKLNGEINLATEYKNCLISSVVTGQIDVRNIPVEDVIPDDFITEDDPTNEIEEEFSNESEE